MTSASSSSHSRSGSKKKSRAPAPRRLRNSFFFVVVRAAVLGLALAWAIILFWWNREGDPRFYRFVKTAPGRAVARVFRWYGPAQGGALENKTEEQMTPRERAVKKSIEESLRAAAPTHVLVFKNNRIMEGRLVEEKPAYVVFAETYGEQNALAMNVGRNRIREIVAVTNELPEVTYRDVRFQMEFPTFKLHRDPPYTILTREPFFRVQHSVEILKKLYGDVLSTFDELVTRTNVSDNIQVLFFSEEKDYEKYRLKYAPQMEDTSGFYSPWADRLVVFNQSSSEQLKRIEARLGAAEASYRSEGASPDVQAELEVWRVEMQRNIARFAEAETQKVLRHEGAHQLLLTYGVQSENHIENDWVIEGLATYCETPEPGDADAYRTAMLRRAQEIGGLIGLEELVNLRSEDGLLSLGARARVQLGYSQAWALTRLLMQPEFREAFFEYFRFLRDPANFREVRRTPAMDLLCRFIELTPVDLDARYVSYIRSL